MYNRTILNESFNMSTVQAVWEKGQPVMGYDPKVWRRDACGSWMKRDEYGNTNSAYGWEIDHIHPKAKGGGDSLYNLQPLQWENNRYKGDTWPYWSCRPKAA